MLKLKQDLQLPRRDVTSQVVTETLLIAVVHIVA